MNKKNKHISKKTISLWLALALGSAWYAAGAEAVATDLGITRFDDRKDPVIAGSNVTYTIKADNSQYGVAENAKVDINIPASFEFISATPTIGQCEFISAEQKVTCNIGSFQPQSSFNLDLTLKAIAPGPQIVSLTARISSTSNDINPGNNAQTEETTIIAGADVSVALDATPNPAATGSNVIYTVETKNSGPNAVSSLQLTNSLPSELTYTGYSGTNWQCSFNTQTANCTYTNTLPANGQAPSLQLTAQVSSNATGTVSNSVSVSPGNLSDPNIENNTATHQLSLLSGADLVIEKTASATYVGLNETIRFFITATNQGSSSAENVRVTDTLPSGLKNIVADGDGWTCETNGLTVSCERPLLDTGSAPVITITATTAETVPTSGPNQTNTALVSTTSTEINTGNNSDTVTYTLMPDGADLYLNKSKTSGTIAQGSDITSTIRVGNRGPKQASGPIKVTDTLEPEEVFVSASGNGWTCNHSGNIVTCEYPGPLAVNALTPILTITTRAEGTGQLTNTACTSTSAGSPPPEGDSNPNNDCDSESVKSTNNIVDLALTKTVDKAILNPNENTLVYTLEVTNNGPNEATYIRLTDRIMMDAPATDYHQATGLVITPEQGNCSTSNHTKRYIYCALGSLASGESTRVTVTVSRPMRAGTWDFEATVYSSTSDDPDPGNNKASAPVTVLPATDLQLTSKTVAPQQVISGDHASYVISFRNNGPSKATNVVIQDTFAPESAAFSFLNASASKGSCLYESESLLLTCSIGDLPTGETQTVIVNIQTGSEAVGPINNTASVTADTYDTDQTNNTKTATLAVGQATLDLLVNASDSNDPAAFNPLIPKNNLIAYTLRSENLGPAAATNVHLSNKLTTPPGKSIRFICDASPDTTDCPPMSEQICTGQNQIITTEGITSCHLDTLGANQAVERNLIYRVISLPDIGGDTYKLNVHIQSDQIDSDASNNTTEELTTTALGVDIEVREVRPSLDTVNLNQPFEWRVTVVNNGPGDSRQTTLVNTLPPGTTLTAPPETTQGSCNVADTGERITCDLGYVTNGQEVIITMPSVVTTYPENGTLNNTATASTVEFDIDLSNNTRSGSLNVAKASITAGVYLDSNDNGIQDIDEPGIANVLLTLSGRDAYGQPLDRSARTASNGKLTFDELPPSDSTGYALTEEQPQGFLDGQESILGKPIPNSIGTDIISNIIVPEGTALTDYLFGERTAITNPDLSQLSGSVYFDKNNNGIRETQETGIPGVLLRLTGLSAANDDIDITIATDNNGNYLFRNLPASSPGGYTITQTQPEGWLDGIESAGTAGGDVSDNQISNIVLAAGIHAQDYLFGEQQPDILPVLGSLSGTVYIDINGNGLQESDDLPVENNTISLTGTTTLGELFSQTTQTSETGQFAFTNLPAGIYRLIQTQPAHLIDRTALAGTLGGSSDANQINDIPLQPGDNGTNYRFTEQYSRLTGAVYFDENQNGLFDEGESGIGGVTLQLSGQDGSGNTLDRETQSEEDGRFSFDTLPASDSNGYTLEEIQPAGWQWLEGSITVGDAGGNAADNRILNIVLITTPHANGYLFGERQRDEDPPATARISGHVWLDENHDRIINEPNSGQKDWIVQLYQRTGPINNSEANLVAETRTNENGDYVFKNIEPGSGYEIRFLHPNGYVYGNPISSLSEAEITQGTIRNITLANNADIPDQNLPIDPSGIIYNAVTRQPISGATVRILGPVGFDPGLHLVGGENNQTQITAADGYYQFLLLTDAPAGTYTLDVSAPDGYIPLNSAMIPVCENTLTVMPTPDPALVHISARAPVESAPIHDPQNCPLNTPELAATANSTQYFLTFDISPITSADVVSNHIPLDPLDGDTITAVKTSPKNKVIRGELVPYTLRYTNNLSLEIRNIALQDRIPPGFKYVENSAKLDGASREPTINGLELTWPGVTFTPNQTRTITLMLIVGAGVEEGEYVNQTWAYSFAINQRLSNIATAKVLVTPDPLFQCSDLIGKVYDDRNINGYPDKGEPGIAGVKLVTARGLITKTDQYGRYHIACAALPNRLHGSNFILKLDERSLPSGFRTTTENPRVVRLTEGKMEKINFGATIHRVIRLDLGPAAFSNTTALTPDSLKKLDDLVNILNQKSSILRLAYIAEGESPSTVNTRLDTFEKQLRRRWKQCDCDNYELIIEREILWSTSANEVGKQPRRLRRD